MSSAGVFTQAQLNALTAAIAQGVTRVEYDGKTVNYASINDMLGLRDRMMRELARVTDAPRAPLARASVFVRR